MFRRQILLTLLAANVIALAASSQTTKHQPPLGSPVAGKGGGYRVAGVVVDDVTGKPLSGATVTLETIIPHCSLCNPEPPPAKPVPPRVTTTGIDGRFAFDGLPEGEIDVTASQPGYLKMTQFRVGFLQSCFHLTEDCNTELRLAPAASISGIARDHTGALLKKSRKNGDIGLVIVTYWAGWPRTQYDGWPTIEPDGTYHFDNLNPGRYYIVVDPPWVYGMPERREGEPVIDEIPERYPAPSAQNPAPYFTVHEGEQKKIDLQMRDAPLHHVTFSAGPASVSQVVATSGSGFILREAGTAVDSYEAWLPDGTYWPTNQRPGEIDGPLPFTVAGADVSGLRFESATSGSTRLTATVRVKIDGSPDLKCEPFPVQYCWLAHLYFLDRDGPSGSTEVSGDIQLTPSPETIETSLLPGRYAAVLDAQRNLYVKSIRSGTFDFSQGLLVIHQGKPPAPIEVELAEGGKVDGIVKKDDGNPIAAYVYGLPMGDTARSDFRLFRPVQSQDDGTFQMEGLAPGLWTIFASDEELSLDVHDPADTAFWRKHGTTIQVETGKTMHVSIKAFRRSVP